MQDLLPLAETLGARLKARGDIAIVMIATALVYTFWFGIGWFAQYLF